MTQGEPNRPAAPEDTAGLAAEDAAAVRAVQDLMAAGNFDEAVVRAGAMASRPELRPIVQRLVAACRYAKELRFQPGARLAGATATILADINAPGRDLPDATAGPLVVERPGSDQVVFVFAGADQAPFAHVVVQSYLKRRRCHAVYVRDPQSQFSVIGLPGLADDLPGCIAGLRRIADRLGARRRFCLGYSANGYSALRYGLGLDADGVLAFSPPTNLAIAPEEARKYPMIHRLQRERPEMAEDLLPLYAAAHRRPRVVIVYGARNRPDSYAARRMEGLPGFRVVPVPGLAGHDSMGVTMVSRAFGPLLDEMFAARPVVAGEDVPAG
ncbi:MAG: hypothetical protein IT561_02935 [Alphaproteobacteria bacterium]|nr:hypothetical protein [Alphaproteobacteria bacterium]